MANQTVVSAAAIWQAFFDTITDPGTELDFTKQGAVYFVENNAGNDDNDGSSWDKAFKTLSQALKVSHAEIGNSVSGYGKGWAARNRIYLKGDSMDEDLTKLAQKTDIIGVGSCHDVPHARLEGNHTIQASATQNYNGCRFFNIDFYSDAASAVMAIPADHNGIEFHNCRFMAVDGATYAIHATAAVHRWKIINCEFTPNATAGAKFATAAILFAGNPTGIEIANNVIYGAIGVKFSGANCYGCVVRDNLIVSTTFCIDDDSNYVIVARNRFISAVDNTTNNNGIIDYNAALAIDNMVTGSNHTDQAPTIAA